MNAYEVACRIAECLEEDGLPYAIGGALALTVWGFPRDTKDVDISIFAPQDHAETVFDSLERAGVMVDRDDARKAIARIGLFSGRFGRTLVDVFVSDHPHFHAMKERRSNHRDPAGHSMWFTSAEDLVINKLIFARTKDIPDLEHLFARRSLDRGYIRSWLTKMVPPGDRRFAILDDLERRFVDKP